MIKLATFDAILVSPLDFHSYVVDLPPLQADHREGAIRFRLRTMHPGDPLDTCIDYRICGAQAKTFSRSGGKVVAFAVTRAALDTYRSLGMPLISGFSLLSRTGAAVAPALESTSKITLRVLATAEWIEIALYNDTELVSTSAIDSTQAVNWTEYLSHIPGLPEPEHLKVFIIPVELSPEELISITDHFRKFGVQKPVIVNLKTILETMKVKAEEIFSHTKKGNRVIRKWILAALIVINLTAIDATLSLYARRAESRLAHIKETYEGKKQFALAAEKLSAEIQSLEAGSNNASTKTIATPYLVISEITKNIHGSWIKSLIIRDDGFQLEAEGADALAVLSSLRTSTVFTDVSLHQATPSPIRGELFSISGIIP